MNWSRRGIALFAACATVFIAGAAQAQKPIRIGYPVILSGPGALIGEPSMKGAQMFVEEINAKGGVLGRKIELVIRDTKGNADEAVRVARDLILRENVDFLFGALTSAEGPAISPIAKENKIVFVVPVVKTDQLVAKENLHPYIFRTASNTTIEGRTAAEIMAKWPNVKRAATISPDYAFGQDVTRAFVDASEEAPARHRDRRPAVAEARRDRLHAVHQRADVEEAGRGVLEPVGRSLRDLRQAGKAAKVFRSRSAATSSARAKPARSRPRRPRATTIRSGSRRMRMTRSTGGTVRRRTRITSRGSRPS